MSDCCEDKSCPLEALRIRQAGTLRIALAINAVMFVAEFISGVLSGSLALLADSLDMLGDALIYGFSLYVLSLAPIWKARAAVAKAAVMAGFGLFVLGQVVHKLIHPQIPIVEAMSIVGALALTANGICFAMLWRHRAEDINMRSVWLCSRNDLVANVGVLIAALGVYLLGSPWPDIAVGAVIATVFLRSAVAVARDARSGITNSDSDLPTQAPSR